jgi:hypothetical protein
MRKLILIASLLLLSASAQAGPSRSLTLASHQEASAEQPKAAEQTKPAQQVSDQPQAPAAKPAEQATATESKAADKTVDARPKRRNVSTEARVIYELHRHGIYW